MIVSILQLMGFPMGKPVHSRAGETAKDQPSNGSGSIQDSKDHPKAGSSRRQDVKAKSGKDSKAKASGKAQTVVKATAKAVAKPTAKVAAKAPVKAVAKPAKPTAKAAKAAKPVAKPAAKPVAKAAPKPVKAAAKSAPKAVVKATPKVAPKAAPKPAPKSAPKAVAKAPVKAAPKVAEKPVAKVTSKAAAPANPKPVEKTPVKTAKAVPPKSEPVSKPKPATPEKAPEPMTVTATKPVPAPAAPTPAAVPQKAGRPSSRLAQLTVPSMAQSVASTAAKASYSQVVAQPVIVPMLPSAIKKDPKLANNWKSKPANELTDAELMAMPDAEYMNDVQMAAFRHRLSILKRDILNSAGETTEHLREDTSVVPDPADRATIEEEHALELRTRDRERKLLKKIEQSIARIDAGDYGYCDETGEPIGVGRLLARPTASLSLEAQQRRELKQKMFGD